MDKFPVLSQKDLELTASVDWSSNTKQIIENDEKEFEGNNLLLTKSLLSESLISNVNINNNKNHLNMSWGNYFAKKSPPLGDLSGSHGPYIRPQFDEQNEQRKQNKQHQPNQANQQNKQEQSELIISENDNNEAKQEEIIMNEETENDDMVVIIDDTDNNKSIEDNIDFNEFTDHYLSNRESNDSNKSDQSKQSNNSNSSQKLNKLIQIPQLKYIQRFYQFTININKLQLNNDKSNKNIEKQIELVILKYIQSYTSNTQIKAYLSAITYRKVQNKCTVLILFDNNKSQNKVNNDEWINHFLSFPAISKIMDKSKHPFFTQLSSP